ncbi:hypothetical protein [Kribbella sp. NPDC023855]|uniref:hypothetical protein n=1 Tax=Kribbella sp. NPDC023855 TaxID=3154698 RepID=UPI0033E6EAF7
MKQQDGRLVALVASVAVAAVVIGGVLAYQQTPQQDGTAAAPLPAQTPPSTPSTTPSKTPAPTTPSGTPSSRPTPSSTPSAPSKTPSSSTPPAITGPTSITLNAGKLPKGREPQLPYVIGREVRGGAGSVRKVPGTDPIYEVGRLDNSALVVVDKAGQPELLKIDYESVRRTAGVSSLVTTLDQSAAAYAAVNRDALGNKTKGGVVYSETGGSVKSLKVPNGYDVRVLAYAGGQVYFRSGESDGGAWTLYAWTPGAAKAEAKKVTSPTAVSHDGRFVASANLVNDAGSCSSIIELATGKQLWRTCENMVDGFTPDGGTAIGGPAYGDGYCSLEQSALAAGSGRLLREWKGCFLDVTAEDDQHFLMVVVVENQGEENAKRAIVRCNFMTGACELATAARTGDLVLSS